jgi:hypothetical protein
MSQASLQAEPWEKNDALELSVDQMQQALAEKVPGRESDWTAAVEEALSRVEAALRQHRAAAREPDGLLAEVDETRPTLARQADRLRTDHDAFLKDVLALREEVGRAAGAFRPVAHHSTPQAAAGVVQFSAIREQAEVLLARLRKHEEAETKLVLESINTDIGTCD